MLLMCSYSSKRWSQVMRLSPWIRAVAAIIWSAGSRWKFPGKLQDSQDISGDIGNTDKPSIPVAWSNQTLEAIDSLSFPRLDFRATSHALMIDIPNGMEPLSRIALAAPWESLSGSSSNQIHAWVSRIYFTGKPPSLNPPRVR